MSEDKDEINFPLSFDDCYSLFTHAKEHALGDYKDGEWFPKIYSYGAICPTDPNAPLRSYKACYTPPKSINSDTPEGKLALAEWASEKHLSAGRLPIFMAVATTAVVSEAITDDNTTTLREGDLVFLVNAYCNSPEHRLLQYVPVWDSVKKNIDEREWSKLTSNADSRFVELIIALIVRGVADDLPKYISRLKGEQSD